MSDQVKLGVCFMCSAHVLLTDCFDYEDFYLCGQCVRKMDIMSDHIEERGRRAKKAKMSEQSPLDRQFCGEGL